MKKLRDFTLTNEEWNCVKRCYLKFYLEQDKCSMLCPLGFDLMDQDFSKNDIKLLKNIDYKRGHYNSSRCVCHQFKEFKNVKKGCPCYILGEKAFIQLEKFIKRECFK